jgi:hypothetical protein
MPTAPWAAVAGAAVAAALATWTLHVRRSHRPQRGAGSQSTVRLFSLGKRLLVSKLLDIGGFFGVDIGGSLTKLVFFLPDRDVIDRALRKASASDATAWGSKVAFVDQIAAFVMSTTKYGKTGVRDDRLSLRMPELGGTFHFIRCVGDRGRRTRRDPALLLLSPVPLAHMPLFPSPTR